MPSFMEIAAGLGVACGALIAVFSLLEKITGVGTRWLARGVAQGTETLRSDVNDVKAQTKELSATVGEVQHLQRYHLGENGGSPRLHDRVAKIEGALSSIQYEQTQVRHDLESDEP